MTDTGYRLVVGDKNYSSWSLRPWLLMRMFDIAFEEINVDIYNDGARERILKHVPSAKVPALKVGGITIWDTLAIVEYLAESHPDCAIWPRDKEARAIARAVSAEMHSGFEHLRGQMPMDMNTSKPADHISEEVSSDIRRVVEIWTSCRKSYGTGGDFLFGDFCAADAMFAPVTSRFRTYGVDVTQFGGDESLASYCENVLALAPAQDWMAAGREEIKERGIPY